MFNMKIYNDEFKILDTIDSSAVYKIVPTKHVKIYVDKDKIYKKLLKKLKQMNIAVMYHLSR